MPKSATHKKVRKNGIDSWIVNEVWAKMEEEGNLQGWEAVADVPVEVQILKQKTKEETSIVDGSLFGKSTAKK